MDVISAESYILAGFNVSDIEPSSSSTILLVSCGSVATKKRVFTIIVTVANFASQLVNK